MYHWIHRQRSFHAQVETWTACLLYFYSTSWCVVAVRVSSDSLRYNLWVFWMLLGLAINARPAMSLNKHYRIDVDDNIQETQIYLFVPKPYVCSCISFNCVLIPGSGPLSHPAYNLVSNPLLHIKFKSHSGCFFKVGEERKRGREKPKLNTLTTQAKHLSLTFKSLFDWENLDFIEEIRCDIRPRSQSENSLHISR